MNKKLGQALILISAASFLSSLYLLARDNVAAGGPILIAWFIALALGVRGFSTLKGFSYTIWIFTAVTTAMFYPQFFLSVGDFHLKLLIIPLLQVKEFVAVFAEGIVFVEVAMEFVKLSRILVFALFVNLIPEKI